MFSLSNSDVGTAYTVAFSFFGGGIQNVDPEPQRDKGFFKISRYGESNTSILLLNSSLQSVNKKRTITSKVSKLTNFAVAATVAEPLLPFSHLIIKFLQAEIKKITYL